MIFSSQFKTTSRPYRHCYYTTVYLSTQGCFQQSLLRELTFLQNSKVMMKKSKEIYAQSSLGRESVPLSELASSWAVPAAHLKGNRRPMVGLSREQRPQDLLFSFFFFF